MTDNGPAAAPDEEPDRRLSRDERTRRRLPLATMLAPYIREEDPALQRLLLEIEADQAERVRQVQDDRFRFGDYGL